jgi:histidine ammonia-lyase
MVRSKSSSKVVALGETGLSLSQWVALGEDQSRITVRPAARKGIAASRRVVVARAASGDAVYGVNTGFGKLASVKIASEDLSTLQRNLLLSHATGVGAPLPRNVARIAFALRIHALARGFSGVRVELIDAMLDLFNAGLTPVVPSQGSVGASGDLAPLAHMALPLLGEGECDDGRRILTGIEALRKLGRQPVQLAEKEGLALINGTQIMTAIGIVATNLAEELARVADICCASTIEALRASARPFLEQVHQLRPHPGQLATASNVSRLLRGSKILPSHVDCAKVQDAYSMRCAPQVHGAAKDGIAYARKVVLTEAHAVTDNPLVFPDGDTVSAGNFHGQPVSQAMDYLKIAVATLANISERRIENLVNPDISGLPPFLATDPGLESGMMIAQVAAAALASENKTLAHPASVDTVPTSANREDHVSMGVTAARHAMLVLENTANVLAIEWIAAAVALDAGEPLRPGKGVAAAHACLREVVAPLTADRVLATDIHKARAKIMGGDLAAFVEKAVGKLAPVRD